MPLTGEAMTDAELNTELARLIEALKPGGSQQRCQELRARIEAVRRAIAARSLTVKPAAHNRLVGGSSPPGPTNKIKGLSYRGIKGIHEGQRQGQQSAGFDQVML
jgi:hypothetical protein